MSWTTKAYCTLDDVKALADRRSATDDDFLTTLIARAQAVVDAELGFAFQTDGTALAPATRVYNGNDATQLIIKPCVALAATTAVIVRTYSISSSGGVMTRTATDTDISADVLLGPASRINEGNSGFILERYSGATFDLGRQNIIVAGIWGYASIPPAITHATARLTAHFLANRDARYQDVSGNDELGKLFYRTQIPADVRDLIRRARGGFPVKG